MTVEKRVEIPVLKDGQLARAEKLADRMQSFTDKLTTETQELRRLITAATAPRQAPAAQRPAIRPSIPASRPAPAPRPRSPSPSTDRDSSLGKSGKRRMLIALAQNTDGLTQKKLSLLAGVSRNGGSWSTYLSALRTAGYIEDRGGMVTITEAGIAALGDFDPLPTGEALIDYWRDYLGGSGARRMFDALIEVYPESLSREELGERSGISVDGGSYSTYLSKLRTLELVEDVGREVRASDTFFE